MNSLEQRFKEHPIEPDEEGGIYAVLDESGNVVPVSGNQVGFNTPAIARDYAGGWTILTTFEEGLFKSDSPDRDWFETLVYGSAMEPEEELFKELAGEEFHKMIVEPVLCDVHASTLKEALRNHRRAVQLARKNPL